MITRVIERIEQVLGRNMMIVATSNVPSDDPLALYVQSLGVKVFRGSLEDVFGRFRAALHEYPCDWFFRISADSPFMNSHLLGTMMGYIDEGLDLITNVQKRTFPHGHSAELVSTKSFAGIYPSQLTAEDREHVTRFYYSNADEFRILNLENLDPDYAERNFVVDTPEDLLRVEMMEPSTLHDFPAQLKVSTK